MRDAVHELVIPDVAARKLGARGIGIAEVRQMLRHRRALVRNPRGASRRRLIGTTDGGRVLTLILQQTTEPTTWQVITGWDATAAERKMRAR